VKLQITLGACVNTFDSVAHHISRLEKVARAEDEGEHSLFLLCCLFFVVALFHSGVVTIIWVTVR